MNGDWSLRRSVADDEAFLWTMLFYASHSDEEDGVRPSDVVDNPDLAGYVEGWKLAGWPGVIAEAKSDPIAAAWLRLLPESEQSNPVFVSPAVPELAAAVMPGHEGQGIGTAMIQRLLADARGQFVSVVLSARADNPAVGLYQRLGFSKVGEITNRVGTRSVKWSSISEHLYRRGRGRVAFIGSIRKMIQEFKEFISKGNVIMLAVGFIMGVAFQSVVNSLVEQVIMPIVAIPFGEANFDELTVTVNDSVIMWGSFVTAAVVFLLTALAVYLFIVKPYNAYMGRFGKREEEAESGPTEIELLIEIRDSLRSRPG